MRKRRTTTPKCAAMIQNRQVSSSLPGWPRATTPGDKREAQANAEVVKTPARMYGNRQMTNNHSAANPSARRLNRRRQNSSNNEKINKQSNRLPATTASIFHESENEKMLCVHM